MSEAEGWEIHAVKTHPTVAASLLAPAIAQFHRMSYPKMARIAILPLGLSGLRRVGKINGCFAKTP